MIEPASTDLLSTLGINGKLFLAQLINFSIVLIVMWKWVYTPLLKLMDKRAKEIADGLKNAQTAKVQLSEAHKEKDEIVAEAKAEAHAILDDTRAKTETMRQEKMALAKTEIEKAVDEAKERIKGEKQAAFDSLKNEMASLVALATEKVAAGMGEKEQHARIQKAIAEIENA